MSQVLDSYASQQMLRAILPFPKTQLVHTATQVKLTPPFVLKLISSQAVHKTELGAVKIVHTQEELAPSFKSLQLIAKAKNIPLQGILVQQFVKGQEIIIGVKKDLVFGHVIALGLGGIYAEVLKDVSIRRCPINQNQVEQMMNDLQAHQIFQGARGIQLDHAVIKKAVSALSHFVLKHTNIIELDINPFIVDSSGAYAVDARIALS